MSAQKGREAGRERQVGRGRWGSSTRQAYGGRSRRREVIRKSGWVNGFACIQAGRQVRNRQSGTKQAGRQTDREAASHTEW